MLRTGAACHSFYDDLSSFGKYIHFIRLFFFPLEKCSITDLTPHLHLCSQFCCTGGILYEGIGMGVSRLCEPHQCLSPENFFSFFFFFYFLQLYCPNGISPIGNLCCLPRGKPAVTESCNPTYHACWVFYCFCNPPNSDRDFRMCM